MAGGSASPDISNQLKILSIVGAVGDLSDGDLLGRFLAGPETTSEAALAALVERHGPMVLRACRHALANTHDAQDAYQATFMVLVRKAGSIRKVESVAGWLHGVALRVAARAKADEARRRVHERRVAVLEAEGTESRASPTESWPELHEEIARLPERYREPVVLCYLEGLSTEAAALRIGCPRGTILSRLARARERLRWRLTRRGEAPPEALLSGDPTPEFRVALAPTLLALTVKESLIFAGQRASGVLTASTRPALLAQGVLYAMTISKLKILGAMALTFASVLGGVRAFATQKPDEQPTVPKSEPAPISVGRWRYEYQSVRLLRESQLPEKANEESVKGWDLFQVLPVTNGTAGNVNTQFTMLFRRPVDVKK